MVFFGSRCLGSPPVPPLPMDEFWIPLLTTLVLLHPTSGASDRTELNEPVGGSVTFRAPDTAGGNAAFWNFGSKPIVTVPFKDPSQPVFSNDRFQKRFAVSKSGRELSISQLTLEDAGNYSVTIDEKTSTFILRVYNELAEPTVTCEAQNCSGGRCLFSVRCSTAGTGLGKVSYTWRVGDQLWDEGPVVLWVNKSRSEEEEALTCTARNPVSSRNVTVTTPDMLCTGAFSSSGFRTAVMAGVGVAALLSALLALLVFFYKSSGWKKFSLSKPKPTDTAATPEYSTLYAEVGPSQQRIPNGIKAKPVDGESSTTIYSLVKRPEQVDDGTAENATVTGLELV